MTKVHVCELHLNVILSNRKVAKDRTSASISSGDDGTLDPVRTSLIPEVS